MHYPRDLSGYGGSPPHPHWPDGARVAVQFVLNYEEGAESCILHGDAGSEVFLSEIANARRYHGTRHLNMESLYEYGSRAGFWRLHRLFTARQVPLTVFGVALALARNREAVDAMLAADWEVASHGYRWLDYQFVPEAEERADMEQAIEIHTRMTGAPPAGFYLGRCSPNTHRLTAEYDNFLYSADTYADDLPYWNTNYCRPLLMLPYTLDANDMRFTTASGFSDGEPFFRYLRDTFDYLYEEGESQPKMMSVGLHCRLAGRPGRAMAVARFLDYVLARDRVWIARRMDIAKHWMQRPD